MKTTQTQQIKNIFSVLILVSVISVKCFSQSIDPNFKMGMSVGTQISGNQHGALFETSINISNSKNIVSVGTLIQKRKNEVCGVSLSYSKPIFDERSEYSFEEGSGRDVQLFFYSKLQYIHKANLSFNAEGLEDRYYIQSNDMIVDFKTYKTSTIEIMGGFGLNLRIFKNVAWTNSIGVGAYNHLNYLPGMYCDKTGPSLVLSTSLRLMNF